MKIGIIGYGVVGKAVSNTLVNKYSILKYDKYVSYDSINDFVSCDFIFITVPTPFDSDSYKVNDSAVVESLEKLCEIEFKGIVIIKSTLPPQSSQKYIQKYDLKICFNPEFLRESKSPNEDFKNQNTVVIGCNGDKIFGSVKKMYQKILVSNARYYHTSPTEAEMIKYAQNTTLASRVSIANIIYDACKSMDLDYETIRKIAFDRFEILGPHMVQVPGPDGNFGFGGKCLPKDLLGFTSIHDSNVLRAIIKYNRSLREDLK
tara:strand:+ start:31872 stop:32654 length:783 start_codon:yes stop_codon:yes gene_type:complete